MSLEVMLDILVPFTIIFLMVLFLLFFIRFAIWLVLIHLLKKYKGLLRKKKADDYDWSEYSNKPVFDHEDEVKRDKEKEKEQELQNVEYLPSVAQQRQKQMKMQMEEDRIVDVVKPIGKFTALILGQKLSYLASKVYELKNSDELGYWTSMIHAQDRSQGKQRGRGGRGF